MKPKPPPKRTSTARENATGGIGVKGRELLKEMDRLGITPGLVRISVGIEDVEDLIADARSGYPRLKASREAAARHPIEAVGRADVLAPTITDKIDAALRRLEEGTYGACNGCGAPIPMERLMIYPETLACSTCACRA